MRISSLEELKSLKTKTKEVLSKYKYIVQVCGGAGCVSSGCKDIKDTLIKELEKRNLTDSILVNVTGCIGTCALGPVMIVNPDGVFYTELKPEDISEIVEAHFVSGKIVKEKTYFDKQKEEYVPYLKDIDYFKDQVKIVLRNCGDIDYSSIDQYIYKDGYMASAKVLGKMPAEDVINEIKTSGLRGRGGAGFPTWIKMESGKKAVSEQKYIVCNADEGDPGAFMDRSILEGDPHSIIEGMMIYGYAIGASKGFVYVRAEYPLAIERLQEAIKRAKEYGLLGENIFNSGFNFDIEIRIGAGAFVCGEETALMESIEGQRGEPRQKPPLPFEKGLFGKPTIINNVETLANIAQILLNGGEWFAQYGTEKSKGTKVFALAGDIQNTGLVEVPMGTSLGKVIFDIGGGIPSNKKFKAVQTGGPSGGCITKENLNVNLDYESLAELGTIMGSGGLVVMDEDTCMVDVARYFMDFVQDESCGKCTPCRIGTKRMLEILERMTKGEGQEGDIELLEELGNVIRDTAICGLGQTAPNPVINTINNFREEYEQHIEEKHCTAGICGELVASPCQNACPAGVNPAGYIALIKDERIDDAYNLIRQVNPFPAVCGRVCTHPCESKCRRGQRDEPISIAFLKRYITDNVTDEGIDRSVLPENGKNIGIIGAGPSGLTCGYYLAKLGYNVDVYEAESIAGGVLAFGIPEYRLPKDVLQKEIEEIKKVGVKIHLNTPVNTEKFKQIKKEHDAVYVAVGTQVSNKLKVSGEDLEGVHFGLDFLREANINEKFSIGNSVVVIGGGNSAIDSARVAKRLGAKEVSIFYRREQKDMLADEMEIRDAIEEGIKINPLVSPVRIIGENGKAKKVEFIKMKLDEFDSTGRKRPVPIEGSEFTVDCDMVIPAISQHADISFIDNNDNEVISKRGTLNIDKKTFMTKIEGVFAGGDAVRGSYTAINAIADGKETAKAIDKYFGGKGELHVGEAVEIPNAPEEEPIEHERYTVESLDVSERSGNFKEVVKCFSKSNAIAECMRCLRCDRRE